jgi:hypothetical protein
LFVEYSIAHKRERERERERERIENEWGGGDVGG